MKIGVEASALDQVVKGNVAYLGHHGLTVFAISVPPRELFQIYIYGTESLSEMGLVFIYTSIQFIGNTKCFLSKRIYSFLESHIFMLPFFLYRNTLVRYTHNISRSLVRENVVYCMTSSFSLEESKICRLGKSQAYTHT